jgi:catechol 2,3-dioxygenase-like lactoylglutathione lyase family enzyme
MPKRGQPKRVDTIIFLVDDIDRSVDFYEGILKLSLKLKSPTWAEFIIGDIHLALHKKSPEAYAQNLPSGALDVSVQFEVDNLEDHVAFLELHGIEIIGGIKDQRFARYAFFTDPDGHILGLREYVQSPETA